MNLAPSEHLVIETINRIANNRDESFSTDTDGGLPLGCLECGGQTVPPTPGALSIGLSRDFQSSGKLRVLSVGGWRWTRLISAQRPQVAGQLLDPELQEMRRRWVSPWWRTGMAGWLSLLS